MVSLPSTIYQTLFWDLKLNLRNSRADKYKKWGPQQPDCYRVKNTVFHQGIITMITIPTVCFKPMYNN